MSGLQILDGPAEGVYRNIRRAPKYLRMVVDQRTGKIDALDQLDDAPTPDETVSVYLQESFDGYTHLDFDLEAGKFANYVNASYCHLPAVDGQKLRLAAAWQDWVDRHAILDEWRESRTAAGRTRIARRSGPNY
jgi:hypothetical protein